MTHSSLPLGTKILCPMIYFRIKTTDIHNQYEIYPRTCTYGLFVLEGVELNVSYSLVAGFRYLCIIISIESVEGLNILSYP